jgi:GMP synthase (glutamine-hydrolysing)
VNSCSIHQHEILFSSAPLAFEDLGILRAPLTRKGFDIVVHDMGVNDPSASEVDTADLIVALGGPIAVYEYEAYPLLVTETRLLGQRLKSLRPTLGICLAAQLMAKALGSRVAPAPVKEIGWGPVQLTSAGGGRSFEI